MYIANEALRVRMHAAASAGSAGQGATHQRTAARAQRHHRGEPALLDAVHLFTHAHGSLDLLRAFSNVFQLDHVVGGVLDDSAHGVV